MAWLGDSLAAGYGVYRDVDTPAVRSARALSAIAHQPVRIANVAVVGSESSELGEQVARLSEPPDIAVIVIGANDVTHRIKPKDAVRHLAAAVHDLRAMGAEVVVGTCPDLGTIRPIGQPLRTLVRRMSRNLAAAQTIAVVEAGGRTVSLGDLLGPLFASRDDLFSDDKFHPSAAGTPRRRTRCFRRSWTRWASTPIAGRYPACAAPDSAGRSCGSESSHASRYRGRRD